MFGKNTSIGDNGKDYSKLTQLPIKVVNALRAEKDTEIATRHAGSNREIGMPRSEIDACNKVCTEMIERVSAFKEKGYR